MRIADAIWGRSSPATLTLLKLGVTKPFLLVPESIEEVIDVEYESLTPPGYGASIHWYRGGGLSTRISFEAYVDALVVFERLKLKPGPTIQVDVDITSDPLDQLYRSELPGRIREIVKEWRWFLMAGTTPHAGIGLNSISPTKVRLNWPHVMVLEGVITSLRFNHEMFFNDKSTRIMIASIEIMESPTRKNFTLPSPRQVLNGLKSRGA